MKNAEKKLDGAKYFLDVLADNLKDPRAFHHSAEALLNNVYAVGTALEDEVVDEALNEGLERRVGRQRYNKRRKAWRETLTKEEQLLVDEILRLRGESVHKAEGISLNPTGVRLTTMPPGGPANITLRKQGASFIYDLSFVATVTGLIEDITSPSLPTDHILAPGSLVVEVEGDSTSGYALPVWRFGDRDQLQEDVVSVCRRVVDLAGNFLQDFRKGKL